MIQSARPDAAAIRAAREQYPKMRERDLARTIGVSEAELVAAWCGRQARRIEIDMDGIFGGMETAGEVMALTRNESAVHEKIGVYDNYYGGRHASMMLGAEIDTRMFPKHFRHAFEVVKRTDDGEKRSLQIFDAAGDAVHKIHCRDATDLDAWAALLDPLEADDQTDAVLTEPVEATKIHDDPASVASDLRTRWEKMTDTHQFVLILRKLGLSRLQAVETIGEDMAWPIHNDGVAAMLRLSANEELPIMCFVGSRGCIQIHSGPISNVKPMGPWLNVMDPTFHLHLRMDQIDQAWAVRKPTDKGHVTSIEAYDANGALIIQFFGKRIEGQDDRMPWRSIVEGLPRHTRLEPA